jgi:hypothetical protein
MLIFDVSFRIDTDLQQCFFCKDGFGDNLWAIAKLFYILLKTIKEGVAELRDE